MIANEFSLITNENGLPKKADHIRLNQSRSERVLRILPASGQTEQAHPREAEAQHCPGRRLGNDRGKVDRVVRGAAQAVRFNHKFLGHGKRRGDADRGQEAKRVRPGSKRMCRQESRRAETVFDLSSNVLSVTDQPAVTSFTVRPLRACTRPLTVVMSEAETNMLSVSNVPVAVALMESLSSDAAVRSAALTASML
jgi:hypothetical protein